MYDGSFNASNDFWYSYRNVKIINFSKTLHNKLLNMGLDSHYIQFFPEHNESFRKGDNKSIFFWHRISCININLITKLFSKIKIDNIHIHKAIDPMQQYIEPEDKVPFKIEYSEWYENKKDMIKDIEKSQIYIAPRKLEGIGMSFLEAMALGRCVVAPNLPTMNEYIEHNKNGILYDIDNVASLDNFDAYELGKNAFDYIKNGRKKWENDKNNILNWIEEPVNLNTKLIRKYRPQKYKLFNFIPLIEVKRKSKAMKIFLFNIVPIYKIKYNDNIQKHFLLGFIPLFKIYSNNKTLK